MVGGGRRLLRASSSRASSWSCTASEADRRGRSFRRCATSLVYVDRRVRLPASRLEPSVRACSVPRSHHADGRYAPRPRKPSRTGRYVLGAGPPTREYAGSGAESPRAGLPPLSAMGFAAPRGRGGPRWVTGLIWSRRFATMPSSAASSACGSPWGGPLNTGTQREQASSSADSAARCYLVHAAQRVRRARRRGRRTKTLSMILGTTNDCSPPC